MFSTRLPWDPTPNALTRALEARRAAGGAIVDLTVSNPSEVGFEAPTELCAALGDPRGGRYAPTPRGLREAREAVAASYATRGVAVDPDRVVLCASTSEAYAWLLKLLCDPGDAVLAPRPSYPLFEHLAALEGVRALPYALRAGDGWRMDLDAIAAAAPDARAVVVVSPHNPTGACLRREELVRLAAIGLPIIADEVFADYVESSADAVASAAHSPDALVFALGGLSKAAALPQIKLAWIVARGPGADDALARLDLIADTYLSVSTAAELAAPKLLAAAPARAAAVRERLARNRAALPPHALPTLGGWNAILRAPAALADEDWALALIERDGVLVHPGYFYDFDEESLLVVSLLPREQDFAEGMRRIAARFSAAL